MKYGIVVKMVKNDAHYKRETKFSNRHDAKSEAGRLFHDENVKSVYVYAEDGKPQLYLRKDANGVHREEAE